MQYTDYISQYQAQKEREQQLVQQYSQKPEIRRPKALWMTTGIVQARRSVNVSEGLNVLLLLGVFAIILFAYCISA